MESPLWQIEWQIETEATSVKYSIFKPTDDKGIMEHVREGHRGIKSTIEEMHELAERRGGKCLSTEYVNNHTKLKWQCKEGHIWEAIPNAVRQGGWCPFCTHRVKLTIGEMHELAKSMGGKCLSTKYIDVDTKLKWQCKEGHIWDTTPSTIKQGHWCPYCADNIKSTIEEMHELAKNRGGKCLSTKYIDGCTKLRWQCKEWHTWETTPSHIRQGQWCPYCAHRVKLTIEEMHELAKKRGGKCLSTKYIDSCTKLKWQCKEGHIWEVRASSIMQSWCPFCARAIKKLTIGEMHELADNRGGKCLSTEYVNNHTKLKWQCREGHIWKATPMQIKQGQWCPVCARNRRKRRKTEERKETTARKPFIPSRSPEGNALFSNWVESNNIMVFEINNFVSAFEQMTKGTAEKIIAYQIQKKNITQLGNQEFKVNRNVKKKVVSYDM